jgi:hypothetical protein
LNEEYSKKYYFDTRVYGTYYLFEIYSNGTVYNTNNCRTPCTSDGLTCLEGLLYDSSFWSSYTYKFSCDSDVVIIEVLPPDAPPNAEPTEVTTEIVIKYKYYRMFITEDESTYFMID